ncbi:serine hydrolase [Dethiobacter alkaliphilus]|uniref:Beta-lactamase class A-like protein n=1 Tax=Dethiobacter alkaliphilus AHT 1 TaxID=555088 RepID=C0GGV0_DETAL|nr:serine hydrolase [Dethiobacter alkaliphilus]EEG77541.1 Beta-lactamase class A-like protein [Dethiobacter alkaliphilus AHT 1]
MKYYWLMAFILIFTVGCQPAEKNTFESENQPAAAMQEFRKEEVASVSPQTYEEERKEETAEPDQNQNQDPEPAIEPEPEVAVSTNPAKTPAQTLEWALTQLPEDKRLMFSFYDFATGETLSHNGDRVIFPASMIKTLYLAVFLEEVKHERQSLDAEYILQQRDKYAGSTIVGGMGLLQYEPSGTKVTHAELLSLMVAESDNVATNIITNILGFQHINDRIKEYGLKNTRAHRKMFDLESDRPHNLTTLDDLIQLLILIEEQALFDGPLHEKALDIKRGSSKCRIGRYAPEDVKVANKLGNTATILADMAIIHFPNREPIALAVMIQGKNRHQIDDEANAELMGRLSEHIINYYLQN